MIIKADFIWVRAAASAASEMYRDLLDHYNHGPSFIWCSEGLFVYTLFIEEFIPFVLPQFPWSDVYLCSFTFSEAFLSSITISVSFLFHPIKVLHFRKVNNISTAENFSVIASLKAWWVRRQYNASQYEKRAVRAVIRAEQGPSPIRPEPSVTIETRTSFVPRYRNTTLKWPCLPVWKGWKN